jgi:hypothetical protein
MEEETFEEKARRLVEEYLGNEPRENIRVVWFCKTLKNWKAMVADIGQGGMFFEVTYNGDKEETYIDAYKKFENVCMPN